MWAADGPGFTQITKELDRELYRDAKPNLAEAVNGNLIRRIRDLPADSGRGVFVDIWILGPLTRPMLVSRGGLLRLQKKCDPISQRGRMIEILSSKIRTNSGSAAARHGEAYT